MINRADQPRTANAAGAPGQGFSLVELVVSMALMLIVTAAVFAIAHPSRRQFQAQLEASDMEQRLRAAAVRLSQDLWRAGSGSYAASGSGPLTYLMPPIVPYRLGAGSADVPGTFKTDAITILFVPMPASQTTLASPVASSQLTLRVEEGGVCPQGEELCGFTAGAMLLIYDDYGQSDTFILSSTSGGSGQLDPITALETLYEPGARVVEVQQRSYFRKFNASLGFHQLVSHDGAGGPEVPAVDHLAGLEFRYYGDPRPPILIRPLTDERGPWTSYGPKPPPPDLDPTGVGPGENCAFAFDAADGVHRPRLEPLASSTPLVELTAADLADGGPWCPGAGRTNRFDADLLRIRKIGIRIRVEAALDALRGPAGFLFSRAGTARDGKAFVPDREVRFEVTPPNLNGRP